MSKNSYNYSYMKYVETRALDPHSFYADPDLDPAVLRNADGDPDPGPGPA